MSQASHLVPPVVNSSKDWGPSIRLRVHQVWLRCQQLPYFHHVPEIEFKLVSVLLFVCIFVRNS